MSTGVERNISMGNKQIGQKQKSRDKMKENIQNADNDLQLAGVKAQKLVQKEDLEVSEDTEPQLATSNSESLAKEVKEAVAEAIMGHTMEGSPQDKSSLFSYSHSRSTENQVKKSPLVSTTGASPAEKHGIDSKRVKRYSVDKLRSFKYLVMSGTLNDLKGSTAFEKNKWKKHSVNRKKKQVAFAVDETVCGLVIGKGGVNVKKLEKSFDVEIIVNAKKSDTATKRIVTIIGYNTQNIEKARQALDYQQVFIPILGINQKRLVAQNSEDKFQRWRAESGVVRIEFEDELENYDPCTHSHSIAHRQGNYKLSTRELIKQKKEESNDLHTGFLRLVGTRGAVNRGQKMIEEELDNSNKSSPGATEGKENDVRVYNMETNYSRVAAQSNHIVGYRGKHDSFKGTYGENSAIYRLWQQQQQQNIPCQNHYVPYQHPVYTPNMYYGNGHGSHRYKKFNSMGNRRRSLKYSKSQKNLDDMLLEGKLSVDQYALRMSRRGK